MTTRVSEDLLVDRLIANLPRSPRQLHGPHESDAELVRLSDRLVLAVTTDSVVEEVETGLYDDPFLIGWMTVAVNLSDLAAVGADPLGILLNVTVPPNWAAGALASFNAGVREACEAASTSVLGGDTNISARPQFGGTAIGLIPDDRIITRRGATPGDLIFVTGPLGAGSAFALRRLKLAESGGFQPLPRLREGQSIRRFASSAMDTSDGLLAALEQLARVNSCGFELDLGAADLLDPAARGLALTHGIPPWVMLAGPHGEFELVFTVAPSRSEGFSIEARRQGWQPVRLGSVTAQPGVVLCDGDVRRAIDVGAVRNLAATAARDVDGFVAELMRLGAGDPGSIPTREGAS